MYFNNFFTSLIKPIRSTFKGQSIGGNISYVVEFTSGEGREEVVHLHTGSYEYRVFKNFMLTRESLESRESLETFLQKQMDEGQFSVKGINVYDAKTWQEQLRDQMKVEPLRVRCYSAFQYHVLGRFHTFRMDRRLRRENRKLKRSQQAV